jgi:hypothetical protein
VTGVVRLGWNHVETSRQSSIQENGMRHGFPPIDTRFRAMTKYDHFTHDELVRLLEARDRRDATRFGLVWEANEIDRTTPSTPTSSPSTSSPTCASAKRRTRT